MKAIKNKEFWIGVAALAVVLKFGDRVPVVGGAVSKAKAML